MYRKGAESKSSSTVTGDILVKFRDQTEDGQVNPRFVINANYR